MRLDGICAALMLFELSYRNIKSISLFQIFEIVLLIDTPSCKLVLAMVNYGIIEIGVFIISSVFWLIIHYTYP